MRHVVLGAAVAGYLAVVAGCSPADTDGGRPKVVPVSGTVIYRGQPVAGAKVTFSNSQANVTSYATTGPDGVFRLTTFKGPDGAVPGDNKVAVRKVEMVSKAKAGFDYAASSEAPPLPEERWETPKRYGKADTSGLTAAVSADGPNDFVFELKD